MSTKCFGQQSTPRFGGADSAGCCNTHHPSIGLGRDLTEIPEREVREIGGTRQILTQEADSVLGRPALPWRSGIAEVDLDTVVDREAGVLRHLFALVPGQRLTQ